MSIEQVVQSVKKNNEFCITTHRSPEADAIGSSLALAHLLRLMGKKSKVVCYDPVPKILDFLPSEGLFQQEESLTMKPDALFVLDCGDLGRTGLFDGGQKPGCLVVNIDHHVTNKQFGGINWVDHNATATGELIYNLMQALGMTPTPEIALCLYATIVGETGFFTYSNTHARTFRLAASLLEYKVDPWMVAQRLRENTPERLHLISEQLRGLERSSDGRVAWIVVTCEIFKRTHTTPEDMEDMIGYPRSLKGVEVAVSFREEDSETVKVSFRSKNYMDVAALAERFGGGGHQKAAGCTIKGTLPDVKKKVLTAVEDAFKKKEQ